MTKSFALIGCCAILLSACSKSPADKLVGNWVGEGQFKGQVQMKFTADKKLTMLVPAVGLELEGPFEIKENRLVASLSVKNIGNGKSGAIPIDCPITWKDNDHIKVKDKSFDYDLVRQK